MMTWTSCTFYAGACSHSFGEETFCCSSFSSQTNSLNCPPDEVFNFIFQILTLFSWVFRILVEPAILIFVLINILKFLRLVCYVLVLSLHKEYFSGYNQGCVGKKVWANIAWFSSLIFVISTIPMGAFCSFDVGKSMSYGFGSSHFFQKVGHK